MKKLIYLLFTISLFHHLTYAQWVQQTSGVATSLLDIDFVNENTGWNAYSENNERLSDYWMETSRGVLHLVVREVHIVLPNEVSYYNQFQDGIARVFEAIFTALSSEIGSDWPLYDKWEKINGTFVYGGDGDGFVDMMYLVARSIQQVLMLLLDISGRRGHLTNALIQMESTQYTKTAHRKLH